MSLFRRECDKSPVKFHCLELSDTELNGLTKLIEENGGEIGVNNEFPIRFIQRQKYSDDIFPSFTFYDIDFIRSCVKESKLVDPEPFRLGPKKEWDKCVMTIFMHGHCYYKRHSEKSEDTKNGSSAISLFISGSTMAPVDKSLTSTMAGFELVCSLKSNDIIPVHKYKSTNTGINVFIAEVDGPVVGGYFCLATEAFDDDGLPHTLEHLIFLGSEKYPYKGVLDLVGNRCLASSINSWTYTDRTVYTMGTVSSEGFLSLMPIYLEHILYPTLTDSGYVTEVHHISGEGEDAGVVYCKMQKENYKHDLLYNELLRAIYPGKCGYKSVTRGALKNLRESTNIEKVRDYHKEFYRPENLNIIITGQVKHTDVFKALKPLEEKIVSKGNRGPFTRPWQNPVPPLTESIVRDVHYPCDDEDNGLVYVGWRGPSAVDEVYDLLACDLFLGYLTDYYYGGPVQKEFVDIADRYASYVSYSLSENSVSILYLMFADVRIEKIPLIKDHLVKILKRIHESGIDMKRMWSVINRCLHKRLEDLELFPHGVVAVKLLGDVLYGNTKKDLEQRLNQIEDFKKLMEEPESYWLNILNRYLIEAPKVVINGIPSCAKKKELTEIEKERVAKQIEDLGKEGLEQKERDLQKAITLNEAPIPAVILSSLPIPGTDDTFNFHHIKSYTTDTSEQHPRFDVTKLPLYTYLDHVNSHFIYMSVIIDTSAIDREARPYLPILLKALIESPVERNGKLVPYEKVVAQLEEDTIAASTGIGLYSTLHSSCGYSHSANLMLQLELSNYAKGVQWIQELLYDTKFTVDPLKIIGAEMINAAQSEKYYGNTIADALMKGLIYNKDSNHFTSSILRQYKFLKKMMKRLNTEAGQKEVLFEMEAVRKILTTTKSMVLYMAVNIDQLTAQIADVYGPWKMLRTVENEEKNRLRVIHDWELMNRREDIPIQGCVMGLGCYSSAFLQCTSCIIDYENPDLAPLLVCLKYLTKLTHLNIYFKETERLLYSNFYGGTNVVGAYKEAKAVVESHINENKWERLLYESAKSSLIFEIIDKEKSVGDMVAQSLLSYFKNVSHDYNHQMVQRVYAVSIDDLSRVATKYLKGLFDPKQCQTILVCHPMKAPEVAESFKQFNHDLKVIMLGDRSVT